MSPPKPNSLPGSAGSFELAIDGSRLSAYIRSVEGGFMKAAVIDEAIGPNNFRVKHTSTVEIEPFGFEVGFAGSRKILKWIQASWKKEYSRKNGQITHGDFNHKGISSQS
jgi:hypothetical protein